MPASKLPNGRWFFNVDDVDAWLRSFNINGGDNSQVVNAQDAGAFKGIATPVLNDDLKVMRRLGLKPAG